ncbi:MAG: DUF3300 domain-containing protein [Candidatus Binatia bacterium]
MRQVIKRVLSVFLMALLAIPPGTWAQDAAKAPAVKQEELDQLLAPIALYPDSLIAQILMASTYPLEVVQADRFAKQNKNLKGDGLTKALEAQTWDPSVKSLVNFPQVLTMMSEKLDMTQKLGDAFLVQQKAVMDTIQSLRAKAQAAGNLKTTKEQTVIVEQKIIKIEAASPQVVYVPVYNPTVVYGVWAYPAYPPYYYYPPGYVATTAAFSFAAGVAVGAAWGYAWGSPNYNSGSVNINNSQNVNINNNINRTNIQNVPASGQGQWQRSASNQMSTSQQVQARQTYRGYTGSALTPNEQQQAQQAAQGAQQQQATQQAQQQQNRQQATQQAQQQQAGQQAQQQQNRQQAQQQQAGQQAQQQQAGQQAQQARGASQSGGGASGFSRSGGAFEGVDGGGSGARSASQRGSASRSSGGGGGASRSSGGGGGGGRRR